MSRIAVTGNPLGTGTFTLASPNSNSDFTLTLPSASGTVDAFASGTKMLFQQTAAPTGWTKDTSHDNKALRVVSGTASTGGSVAFTTAFASGLSAGDTTLTTAQMPSHTHSSRQTYSLYNGTVGINGDAIAGGVYGQGPSVFSSMPTITTGSAGSGSSHNHTLPSFAVAYVDLIIATKN